MDIFNNLKSFSRSGQDIITYGWLQKIGIENKIAVEFGAENGIDYSNIRMFASLEWTLFQWDKNYSNQYVVQENINAENINQIFEKHQVPKTFDVLSIDIDGNDYWVWKNLQYEPNILIIEYNPNFSFDKKVSVKYDPNRSWKGNVAFGASFSAMIDLGKKKGYTAVCSIAHDLIFVKNKFIPDSKIYEEKIPKLPNYIHRQNGYNQFVCV